VINRPLSDHPIRTLLRSGLTVRDVAELLRAHPRAIEALIGLTVALSGASGAAFGRLLRFRAGLR
jgi:hypothetical protein